MGGVSLGYLVKRGLVSLSHLAVDLVYPPLCACCHCRLQPSEYAVCVYCGSKLVGYEPRRWHAEERLWSVPAFRNLYGVYLFRKGEPIQEAVHAFKYQSYLPFIRMVAERALLTLPLREQEYDLIIAVPTTYLNQLKRGYNQSLIFAKYIARALGVEVSDRYILSRRNKLSQTHKTRWMRRLNAVGQFYLNPRHNVDLSNRRILIIDDVITTGATLTSILTLLERAGAKEIDVLVATVAV